jgi:uncharacterized membrane protein
MRPRVLADAVTVAIFVLVVGRVATIWRELPPRFASHFDATGRPDAWSSRIGFITLFGAIFGALALFFTFALPALLRRLPPQVINMPNRDYWLAPERREASIARLSDWLAWFGAGITAFGAAILELSLRANLAAGRMSSAVWIVLGAFLIFVVGWLVGLYRAFRTGK